MGEMILILIAIILAAKGDYTLFWIFGGIVVLVLICSVFGKGKAPSASRERPRTRIDIPHYYDADEYYEEIIIAVAFCFSAFLFCLRRGCHSMGL